jgi:N-acetylneuraminic acid mutarotase
MNLAAHGGKVYRVGGMQPRNEPGTPTDNVSVAQAARFDPKVGKWEALPDMPDGRSSHDIVVVGDKLVVVGGWNQKGKDKPVWHDTMLTLDLAANNPKWESSPQPFKRRALTAAAIGANVYVIGGLGADVTDPRVDVLDTRTGKWTHGPKLPGNGHAAFSPAAGVVNGRLIVNTSAGPVFRLNATGEGWEKVGDAKIKRMVARLVPFGDAAVVLVGGAGSGGNVDAVEIVRLAAKGEPVVGGK